MKLDTKVLHAGYEFDSHTGAVSMPIYQVSTFKQQGVGIHAGYEYSRTGNPTREALERTIAVLENGATGLAFASGLAAISTVFMLFRQGDHIIAADEMYGGTFRILDKVFRELGLEVSYIDVSNPVVLEAAIQSNTRAVFMETPTNPLYKVLDINAVSKTTSSHNILLIIDNTLMTPYLQRPLDLGADIVVHSGTKYLGGHSDLIAGLVVTKTKQLGERLHFLQNAIGGILGPFDAWLLMRGIKTLAIRMDKHEVNAKELAPWLTTLPGVKKVYYPGLPDHPQHNLARQQASGFGGMISFELHSPEHALKMLERLQLITLAESLGGVESLICLPAQMTHASIPPEKRQALGISDSLVRLSVGIENVADIKADLLAALDD